jgi:metallopeptidase MepB
MVELVIKNSSMCNVLTQIVPYSSQVYSTDMFYTVFKSDPMNGKEGRRYRHIVLERGGSQDEMTTLTEFLGRAPKTDAFYQELGLA